MILFSPLIATQFSTSDALISFLITIFVAFIIITIVTSFIKFEDIINLVKTKDANSFSEEEDKSKIFRASLAMFLSKHSRASTSFIIVKISISSLNQIEDVEALLDFLKLHLRDNDIILLQPNNTLMILVELEHEDYKSFTQRIIDLIQNYSNVIRDSEIRVGVAAYPVHGSSGDDLIQVVEEACNNAKIDDPIIFPNIIEDNNEDEVEVEDESPARLNRTLDPETGVLKEEILSTYMQRRMSELRLKKKPCVLFCIKVSNFNYIKEFHGEKIAKELLAGVSEVIQNCFRKEDILGTYDVGGFMALVECSLDQAVNISRRITMNVGSSTYSTSSHRLKSTLSIGVASYPEHGNNLHKIYVKAQKVLDYCYSNDIRGYVIYDEELHGNQLERPLRSIKSKKI
mgnify:CR=1 FL=1